MFTRETILSWQSCEITRFHTEPSTVRASELHFVTSHDLRALEEAIDRGRLPKDFDRKLAILSCGTLIDQYVEQTSRLMFSLLVASRQGLFPGVSRAAFDRLLRVLAYVRKDEDAIPDYRSDGFRDDAREIRAVEGELKALLQAFKSWRLRHQVPDLWARAGAHSASPRSAAG